jgi:hypothetical protein
LEHQFATPSKRSVEEALDIATLFLAYGELVQVPSMNWTLSGGISVRYDYEEMVFSFFEKEPPSSSDEEVSPMFCVSYGEAEFQGFYDFLIKKVPAMQRGAL